MTASAELGLTRPKEIARGAQTTRSPKPVRYSDREIGQMIIATPEGLEEGQTIHTPVGAWQKIEGVAVFEMRPTGEIEEIRKPRIRERAVRFLKTVSMIS